MAKEKDVEIKVDSNGQGKEKEMKKFLASLNKDLGTNISRIKDRPTIKVDTIPSGSYSLDAALGVGGYPRGRIIEVFGKESGGKTLLSLLAIAEAQKLGGEAVFIDVEHAFDPEWSAKLGVDVPNLVIEQPDYGEQALEMTKQLAGSNKIDIIVIDSVAALIPKVELERELTDQDIALQARMMSKALRQMTPVVGKSKAVVLFINQVRDNVGIRYGNPEITPGGKALKFFSSLRISVNRKGGTDIKEGTSVIGHTIRAKVVKNKVAPPFKEGEFIIKYTEGIDRLDELAQLSLNTDVVLLNGPMYKYGNDSWKGRNAFVEALKSSDKLRESVWKDIQNK